MSSRFLLEQLNMVARYALHVAAASMLAAAQDPYFPQFHVRPATNWINDPNGPMVFNGVYHLFTQYNPWGPIWGNMSWSHHASADLVHWTRLPVILFNNDTYDSGGVFSGSVTIANSSGSASPVISYTCVGPNGELQCQAYPEDASDPLLKAVWHKDGNNPLIPTPPPSGGGDFRDDTTAWWDSRTNQWLMAVGARLNASDAAVVLYSSPDFKSWTFSNIIFEDPGQGMNECPDFYTLQDTAGQDTGLYGLKYSRNGDWVTVGNYDATARLFTPVAPRISRLYDYGQAYASKSFWDAPNNRRVLWIWVAEESNDAQAAGWQGMQSIPRVIQYDSATGTVVTPPLPELTQLRSGQAGAVGSTSLTPGQTVALSDTAGSRIEVEAYFQLPSGGSSTEPLALGIVVLATPFGPTSTRIEYTRVPAVGPLNNTDQPGGDYLDYALDPADGDEKNAANCSATCDAQSACVAWTYVRDLPSPGYPATRCSLKSSLPAADANNCCISGSKGGTMVEVNRSYTGGNGPSGSQGGPVPSPAGGDGGLVHLHVFVDGSIIEAFVNGGRAAVTSRVYPRDPDATGVGVYAGEANSQPVQLLNATVWTVGSIWTSEEDVLRKREEKMRHGKA